jgi:hypothetical protein
MTNPSLSQFRRVVTHMGLPAHTHLMRWKAKTIVSVLPEDQSFVQSTEEAADRSEYRFAGAQETLGRTPGWARLLEPFLGLRGIPQRGEATVIRKLCRKARRCS